MTDPTHTPPQPEPSKAHDQDWHESARSAGYAMYRVDRYRSCSWCGSCHPADLAQSIREHGTRLHFADWKYGWPHKAYINHDSPNPKDFIKFYTAHLKDATPEDKLTIERALGLSITFEGNRVSWAPSSTPGLSTPS